MTPSLCLFYRSYSGCFFINCKVLNQLAFRIFSLISFAIWHMCNLVVFGRRNSTTSNIIQWALQMVESKDPHSFSSSVVSIPSPCFSPLLNLEDTYHWSISPYGSFKVNYDAIVLNGNVVLEPLFVIARVITQAKTIPNYLEPLNQKI